MRTLIRKRLFLPGLVVLALLVSVTGYLYISNSKASTALPADINNDGLVNVLDLSLLLSAWGKSGVAGDINSDSTVNVFDLSYLLSSWGKTATSPSPTAVATATPRPISNPTPMATPPASEDHREWMHGVDLVEHAGKYMVVFASNQNPPVQPSGDWVHDIFYSYIDIHNAAATFVPKVLVSATMAQEPASSAVNSDGRMLVTSEDAQFSEYLDQTYGIWDSNLNKVLSYGAKLMPPQGGHSGHVAASGNLFMVSFSDGWVDGGGVDNLGTGDDVFAKIVDSNGVARSMINTAVGTNRDWWSVIAGSDTNWLQVWQRYGSAGTGGGTVLGNIIDHSGNIVKQVSIYSNNKYYYHDVQYIPALGLYLVVGSQNVASNSGVAVLIDKQGNVVSRVTGLPDSVRESQTVVSADGKTAVYAVDGVGVAVLDVTSDSIKLRKTVPVAWNWDYMGTDGIFVSATRVLYATGTHKGLKFINVDL